MFLRGRRGVHLVCMPFFFGEIVISFCTILSKKGFLLDGMRVRPMVGIRIIVNNVILGVFGVTLSLFYPS